MTWAQVAGTTERTSALHYGRSTWRSSPMDWPLTRESLIQTYELFEDARAVELADIEDWATTKYRPRK